MAKTKAKAEKQTRAEASRAAHHPDPDRFNRVIILSIVAAVVLAAVGFIGFGWYQTEIRPLGKTVLRVEDTKFDLAHLQRRMQNAVDSGTASLNQGNFTGFPESMLDQLELEASLLAAVGDLDIEVTEEDIDAEIRDIGNLADDVSARAFAEEYRRQVDESGLTQREYRQMIGAEIAAERALGYFAFLAPSEEPQVRWRWIITETEEGATEAVSRLEAGEDFLAVGADLGFAGTTLGEEDELPWQLHGGFPDDAIEEFLFEGAEEGERSDVLVVNTFFYIVELVERDENRPLDADQRQLVGSRELSTWVASLELDIERDLSQEDAVRVLNDLDL